MIGEERICWRCGDCCKRCNFTLNEIPVEKDIQEFGRWAIYHGAIITENPVDGVKRLRISLPYPCKYLEKQGNIYGCAIYQTRPKMCKEYWCEKSMINMKKILEVNGMKLGIKK